jgi:nucleoside 2-deoxyribosyltransferase
LDNFKIYLAGGMGNLSMEEQTTWRNLFIDIIKIKSTTKDYKYILEIINPPQFYNFIDKRHDSELEIMKYDLRHVKTSNLIIVNFNDPKSIGTAQELAVAYEKDIAIIGINEENKELHPWLTCCCDKMINNVKDCAEYIIDFYLT